ncbi:MAG: hypothetical protein FWC40_00615 [Proteobacteria bacterium]|nr:hypothetical protein [Pseudomonadota bacterium]
MKKFILQRAAVITFLVLDQALSSESKQRVLEKTKHGLKKTAQGIEFLRDNRDRHIVYKVAHEGLKGIGACLTALIKSGVRF